MAKKLYIRVITLLICLITAACVLPSFRKLAQGEERTVKVGWYESPFNFKDKYGKRSGYAYEYQRKIAAYTGWNYEYVEDSWPDLMAMLIAGEIDLMSDISYTEERAETMLFSELPMGSEEYYIFIDENNTEINSEDYSTFNGKIVGVSAGGVQIGFFNEWETKHGVSAEIKELECSVAESIQMLHNGEIDAYLTLDSFADSRSVPVCHIGSSVFYFAVNNDRYDLLNELNGAMSKIREEDKNYNERLSEKYMLTTSAHLGLTETERAWLDGHGTIRVGYQDNYMAFCATDEKGQLTGALKDYLEFAKKYVGYENLNFEAKAYPTAAAALSALKNGDLDCVFPINLTDSEAELQDMLITPSIIRSEMQAVVRKTEKKEFAVKQDVKVAVNRGNTNYDMFLDNNFPG